MTALTFARYANLTGALPPRWRAALHARLPEPIQAQAWRALRAEIEHEREDPPTMAVVVLLAAPRSQGRRAA